MTYQEKLVPTRNDAVLISTHFVQKYVRSLTRRRKNTKMKKSRIWLDWAHIFLLFIECECFPRSIRMTKTTATFFLIPGGGPALKTQIHKTVIPFVFVSLLVFSLIRQRQGRDGVSLLAASVHLVQAPGVTGRGKLRGVIRITLNIKFSISFVSLFPFLLWHSNVLCASCTLTAPICSRWKMGSSVSASGSLLLRLEAGGWVSLGSLASIMM